MPEDSSVVAPADVSPEESETAPVLPPSPSNGKAQDGTVGTGDDAAPKPAGMSCCKKLMCTSLCLVVSFVAFIGIGLQVGFVTVEDADEASSPSARSAEFTTATGASSGSSADIPPELAYLQGQVPGEVEQTRQMQVLVKSKDSSAEASEPSTSTAKPTEISQTTTVSDGASVVARNSSQNESANATKQSNLTAENASANASNQSNVTAEKAHEHRHLSCKGGPVAVCKCLLSCEIFGRQPETCTDSSKAHLLGTLVQEALNSTETACIGMQCIARCSKRLGCYDEKVENDCRSLEERTKAERKQQASSSDEAESHADTCQFECDADDDLFDDSAEQEGSTEALEE